MKAANTIRIATRSSPLALWQANAVRQKLELSGNRCRLVLIESEGDLQLSQPIYSLGISGVFTKQLDIALLNDQADIAVHSLKDVPTQLAKNLTLAAMLERGAHEDVVIYKREGAFENNGSVIATSSLRRRAQWLAKFPGCKTVPIRGNVQTRLRKFEESREMDAIIFAKAGLERLGLLPEYSKILDWMLPAPAQGIIGIICREGDQNIIDICNTISHRESFIAGFAERQFLHTLMGGCSVPISALVQINDNEMVFHGAIHSFDGAKSFEVLRVMLTGEWENAGKKSAESLLQQKGAAELLNEIRNKKFKEPQ